MASRVKLLPESLINRIAAGEVVERPASILKELVENSLDAGASKIEIDIEEGGQKLIRVADNGCGLNKEELFLCLERHATSKLDENSDLMSIKTLGFRGEALPSIASVSKLSITSFNGSDSGHRLKVEGGKVVDLSPAPANQGTVIEVRDVFYNVPARRKFLKSKATETAHLLEAAQRYALSRTGLRLVMRDGSKEILRVDERSNVSSRIMTVLGREVAKSLLRVRHEEGDLQIDGYLAGPDASARSAGSLFLFVLGRPVRDRLLTKAVTEGYGRILPGGRFPAGAVFLEIDPARVDVNVHPAKTEVRFREPGIVFSALSKAVRSAVDASPLDEALDGVQYYRPPDGGLFPKPAGPRLEEREKEGGEKSGSEEDKKFPFRTRFSLGVPRRRLNLAPGSEPVPPWMESQDPDDGKGGENEAGAEPRKAGGSLDEDKARGFSGQPVKSPYGPQSPDGSRPESPPQGLGGSPSSGQKDREEDRQEALQEALPEAPRKAPGQPPADLPALRALAQLHQSYILAQGPKGLYIIDQHAAHERIIFNRLKSELGRRGLSAQGLLIAQTMELGGHEALAAERLRGPLERLGFVLEPFGGGTFVLKAVPGLLSPAAAKEALKEILAAAKNRLRSLEGAGVEDLAGDLAESWLYSLACRAAVKAGDRLSLPEMERLIEDMEGAGGHCPHGRPSVYTVTLAELEKRFGRS
ncbi:MAG: DNA mismatch repair endonuclease MutL [Deltaproteobacteria bacterium]|jgi:DNA mismatch repair protein MutL|nr:DNA mismatch repair endonuclease MutL [Deltaproteobacteria bacterium]